MKISNEMKSIKENRNLDSQFRCFYKTYTFFYIHFADFGVLFCVSSQFVSS